MNVQRILGESVRARWGRVALVAAALGALGAPAPARAAECMRIAIPAYFYPGPTWSQAIAGAPTVGTMVMNPASGPGEAINTDYVATVAQARAAGIAVLGYVYTSYGDRPLAEVTAEIDAYALWYGVDGIFLDESSSDAADLAYYQAAAAHVRAATARGVVMLNPGTYPAEAYLSVADLVLVFEGAYGAYQSLVVPSWVQKYAASHFAHVVYSASSAARMKQVMKWAKARGAGHVFVTADRLPNPYDTLPSYWTTEVSTTANTC